MIINVQRSFILLLLLGPVLVMEFEKEKKKKKRWNFHILFQVKKQLCALSTLLYAISDVILDWVLVVCTYV